MRDGYCAHGRYVGGSGIDWICGLCENGLDVLIEIKGWEVELNVGDGESNLRDLNGRFYEDRDEAEARVREINALAEKHDSVGFLVPWLMPAKRQVWVARGDVKGTDTVLYRA